MKVLNWIIALLGLWEFGDIAALFVPDFGHVSPFVWNHIIVGLILMIAGARAALTRSAGAAKSMDWIAAAAGAWLILASLIVGAPEIAAGLWNDLIVGFLVLILGIWAALASPRAAG